MDRAHLRDLLVASDPELARLRQAARATITAIAATLVLDQIARAIGQPTSVALVGINMAMLGTVLVTDPAPRAQQVSHALVPVVASVALTLGTLAAHVGWLRDGLLLVIVFAAIFVRRYGARGQALGTVGFLAYFFALFFQARRAELPLMIAGIFVAAALGHVVRFGLLRERPAAVLARRIVGLRATIAEILHALARTAADGRVTPRRISRVQRGLGLVNESALAIEELIERDPPRHGEAIRDRVFALELAIEVLAAAVREWLASAGPGPLRTAVCAALDAARGLVRQPDPARLANVQRAVEVARVHVDGDEAALRVLAALEGLMLAAPLRTDASTVRGVAIPTVSTPAVPPAADPPTLRLAIQATLAAGLALAAGEQLSNERAYWAVIAAFMVFTRGNTLGAMLVRAWQRVIGTVAGVLVGLLIAEAVQGQTWLELGVVFACMFVAYYTLQVAYAYMVAAFTTLIAVLYSLLGKFSPELLYMRVLETLIGAGVGAAVAALVFPNHTRVAVRRSVVEGLDMLADHLARTLVHRTTGERLASARILDRKLRELRTEVQRAAGVPSLRLTLLMGRVFVAFSSVVFHARPLVAADRLAAADPALRAAVTALAGRARAVARQLEARARAPATPTDRPPEPPDAPTMTGDAALLRSFGRVDEALRVLSRVISEVYHAPPLG